jgi:hypothetical protein
MTSVFALTSVCLIVAVKDLIYKYVCCLWVFQMPVGIHMWLELLCMLSALDAVLDSKTEEMPWLDEGHSSTVPCPSVFQP